MHAGAAVDVRRVLVGKEGNLVWNGHEILPWTMIIGYADLTIRLCG